MIEYRTDGIAVEFQFRGNDIRITNEGCNVWRLRSKSKSGFDDMGAAQTLACDLGEEYKSDPLPVEIAGLNDEGFNIKAFDGSYVYAGSSFVAVYNSAGNLIRKIEDIRTGTGR